MKKIYLFVLTALAASFVANAQYAVSTAAQKARDLAKLNVSISQQRSGLPVNPNQQASVVWTDDFSAGGNWVMTHTGGTSVDWTIGTTGPSGNFPIQTINSATASNGFAIFDSDFYCDTANGQVANMTTAFPIDMTGHDSIRLSFSQYYKRFYDSTYVFVSNDGSTWTKFEVNAGIAVNSFSANNAAINPNYVDIDISSVAGNQDSVYIRFQFYSPNALGIMAGCGYSWMIDDVSLSDFPAVDATLDQAFVGEYSMLPVIQPEPFTMRGKIINKGLTSFSGAKILFGVYDPLLTPIYIDSTATTGIINPGDTTGFLTSLGSFAPADTGLYIVAQYVDAPGDGDSTNNTTNGFIYVSDSMYARDYLDFDINSYGGRLGFQGAPVSFGNIYSIYHPSELTSATFYLAQPTLNDHISVTVYDMVGGVPTNEIGTTGVYTITPADTGGTAFITLPFSPWVNVGVGDYLVSINQLDTNRLTLGYTSYISSPPHSFLNLDGGGWNSFDTVNFNFTPILRVNNPSGTLVSVKSPVKNSAFTVYPNPSTGIVYFTGSNQTEKNVVIRVINNLGAIVKSFTFNSVSQGKLDLSSLPAGVYSLNIKSNTLEENKTIVLE